MLHLGILEALRPLRDPEISRVLVITGVSQHLHQDLPEGVSLAAMEALALVEASVVGLLRLSLPRAGPREGDQ